jgi:hypothetical protein
MGSFTPQQQEFAGISQDLGMGVGTTTAFANAAPSLLGSLGKASPFLAIGASIAGIVALVFHGADPNQVPAAKIHQVFVGASDKLYAAHKAGMITQQQASAGMDWLSSEFDAFWRQYPNLGSSTNSNITNTVSQVHSQIISEKSAAMQVSDNISIEINPDAVSGYYPADGTSGWYSDSIKAADQLAAQYLASLPKNFPTVSQTGTEAISELTSGNFTALGQTIQKSSLFVWGGILLVGFGLWKVMGH